MEPRENSVKVSPYFEQRNVEENLELLKEMKDGKHAPGQHVLRARIDMSSPNMVMRDPILMRVRDETHTFSRWKMQTISELRFCALYQ